MSKIIDVVLSPEVAFQQALLEQQVLKFLKKKTAESCTIRLLKRSIDARSRQIKVNIQLEIFENEPITPLLSFQKEYPSIHTKTQAVIIGAGPAGMFAALRLIELGIKPIMLERGKDVRSRRRDLAAINKDHIVNPSSNYCFGEGGAGTYSDGKLYTRSKKRGDIRRVLEILVAHGANEQILADAHPHIGTNKLPQIVQALRESILQAGGEIHFETQVTDFNIQNSQIKAVITQKGDLVEGIGVILATGHSARDIFELLDRKKIYIEAKPFALGVRVEHPQPLIDKIQYHTEDRGAFLPAAAYSLVSQINFKGKSRGVFSFCMCPGGFIVPAATAQGEVVVNGMSPSKRNSPFANSGIVVTVDEEDWKQYQKFGALAGLKFQQAIEHKACQLAGNTQNVPTQRLFDFVQKKVSSTLLKSSYQPGLTSMAMDEVLPDFLTFSLREGFKDFGKKMKSYLTNEAQIVGVESRTSSPVRIPRDKETLEHPQIKGLFPCGEGAGFAGGIMSAAMDGERCAEKLAELYHKKNLS